jgi:hypothetical protein
MFPNTHPNIFPTLGVCKADGAHQHGPLRLPGAAAPGGKGAGASPLSISLDPGGRISVIEFMLVYKFSLGDITP